MKNYLTKLVSNTIYTYMYNRLKPLCEIIADELKALEEKRDQFPQSERIQEMYEVKLDEYNTATYNCDVYLRKIQK